MVGVTTSTWKRAKMTTKAKRKKRPASSYVEAIRKMTKEYFELTGNAKATTREIATWALQNNRWEPPSDLVIQCCRDDIARAMREEYITGPDGKPVRAKHAARISEGDTQTTFWADIGISPKNSKASKTYEHSLANNTSLQLIRKAFP